MFGMCSGGLAEHKVEQKKKKVGHAVVSHMATCKHDDKGKQDIDRFC